MTLLPKWVPRAPFADLPTKPSASVGVIAQDRDGLGIASVLMRRGQHDALVRRVKEQWGIELLSGPRRSSAGGFGFIGIGPSSWLATSEGSGNSFAGSLAVVLGDCASIADQSDGQAVLRLSGPKVRQVLSKLIPIDLHPRAFAIGNVSVTMAAHMSVTVWRLEDDLDGHAVFEIALFRSFAESFWIGLSESAAEFGLQNQRPRSDLPSLIDQRRTFALG